MSTYFQKGVISSNRRHAGFLTFYFAESCPTEIIQHILKVIFQIQNDIWKAKQVELTISLRIRWSKILFPQQANSPLWDYEQYISQSDFSGNDNSLFPLTGGDLLLHIKNDIFDKCFQTVKLIIETLKQKKLYASICKIDELYGWMHDISEKNGLGRDFTGFEDGTENPQGEENRKEAALIDSSDSFHGGSFVLFQKWIHQHLSWFLNQLPVSKQEKDIFGRTKKESFELQDKHQNAHIQRVVLENHKGEELEIVRQSMSFGHWTDENGLLFVGYSSELLTLLRMLFSMLGKQVYSLKQIELKQFEKQAQIHDHVFQFSKCIASQLYYVPSMQQLQSL